MQIVGRPLTAREVAKVKHPFATNTGKSWDIKTVADYIERGAAAMKGTRQEKAIEEGIKALADE